MKLEVNQKGLRQDGKLVPVGTVLEIKGDTVPASMVGKVGIINPAGEKSKGYDDLSRADLDKLAEERGVDIKDAKNKGDVIAALQLADEAAKNA